MRVSSPDQDCRDEPYLLLDPANAYDTSLLSFSMEGNAIPSPSIVDKWEKERVSQSVKRCRLDFPALENKRKTVWNDCWVYIQDYLQELDRLHKGNKDNPIARHELASKADAIKELVNGNKELSSVVKACILSTGDPRVIRLL